MKSLILWIHPGQCWTVGGLDYFPLIWPDLIVSCSTN